MDENILEPNHPAYIREKYAPGAKDFVPVSYNYRLKILDYIEKQLDKLFLNKDLSINYSGLTDAFLRRYFRDLEIYYTNSCPDDCDVRSKARHLIRQRLADTLKRHRYDQIFLIGHSMGTIVAYDVLSFLSPVEDVHTLATLGSPLGFPVIQGKIAAEWYSRNQVTASLTTPECVSRHWYNFADLKDNVALVYDLSENYAANSQGVLAEDFVVCNDYATARVYNPHKSYGYLRTKEFAEVLYLFTKEKTPVLRRIKSSLWKLITAMG